MLERANIPFLQGDISDTCRAFDATVPWVIPSCRQKTPLYITYSILQINTNIKLNFCTEILKILQLNQFKRWYRESDFPIFHVHIDAGIGQVLNLQIWTCIYTHIFVWMCIYTHLLCGRLNFYNDTLLLQNIYSSNIHVYTWWILLLNSM